MPENRFFLSSHLIKGNFIELSGEEAHHMLSVMRCRVGDRVELVNGKGFLAISSITKITKGKALLEITSVVQEEKPNFEIILAQGLPRLNRLDLILEKGTELGVDQFWFFPAIHSEKKALNAERADKILIGAMKQCGRLFLPKIEILSPLLQWTKPEYPLFFGDLSNEAMPLQKAFEKKFPMKGLIFCIGPEKGFDIQEELFLKSLGAIGVKLHNHILRTDTAAICALSQIAGALLIKNY